MAHRDRHPMAVEGCFGCKVAGLGFDGGHLTSTRVDELGAVLTSHRSGREDVTVRPPRIRLSAHVSEERA